MRSFLNNQSIDCTAGRLSISSAAPVLCGGNVGCIPRVSFMWVGFSIVCQTLIWAFLLSPEKNYFYTLFIGWVVSVITFGIFWVKSHSTYSQQFIIPLETKILFFGDLYHFRSTHKCTRIFFYLFIFLWKTCVGFSFLLQHVVRYGEKLWKSTLETLFWFFSTSLHIQN